MKRHPIYDSRRPSRINMFLEWIFLVVVICLVAVLLSKIWLRAAGQEDTNLLTFISGVPTVTAARIDALDSSATAAARLRSSQVPIETATIVDEMTPTPVIIGAAPTGGFGGAFVGQLAPDFTLPTLEGDVVTLSKLRGQPILINLWASWCPPCHREMPVLAAAQQRETDIQFVLINQGEDATRVQNYLSENQLVMHNVLLDSQGQTAQATGMYGLPSTLFYNANGELVDSHMGEISHAVLAQKLQQLK